MKEVNGYNPSKDPRLIDCKTECGNGKCYARRYSLFAEKACPNFVEPKPQTNADRIRAMSDYDLTDWIAQVLMCHGAFARSEDFDFDRYCADCPLDKCCNDQPSDNIEDWLKAPVKEADNG